MKKNLVLGVVLVLVLALSSCSKNIQENQAAEGDSVRFDLIGEFERADREKFNSPAEENGLGGTRIFMDGTIRDINSEQSSISGTL